ncbi:hypothetical protein BGW80DRAFT_1451002 [Lactifluus volemus]|nr:hypothetical protein BGW80DRAFT_1451002 [Lactifluus volemus]
MAADLEWWWGAAGMPQGQCRRATVGTAAAAARGDGKGHTEKRATKGHAIVPVTGVRRSDSRNSDACATLTPLTVKAWTPPLSAGWMREARGCKGRKENRLSGGSAGKASRGGIATAAWRQRACDGCIRVDDDGCIREKDKRRGGDDTEEARGWAAITSAATERRRQSERRHRQLKIKMHELRQATLK